MKIGMISIGSTGDLRPYLLLGRELKGRGYDVKICAFQNFETEVLKWGFDFLPIKRDAQKYMHQVLNSNKGGIDYMKNMLVELQELADVLIEAIDTISVESDIIVSTFFGSFPYRIAEKYGKKYVQTHFFPMDINDTAPIASAKGFSLGTPYYKLSYVVGHMLISIVEKVLATKYSDKYDIPPFYLYSSPDYKINGKSFPVIYAMSSLVLPRYEKWDDNIHVVGYFVDNDIKEFTPSKELEDFLNSGEEPIYIGFGSMVSDKLQNYMDESIKACESLGIRAVVVKGWGDLNIETSENIFVSDAIPHDYIFKKVKAVIHHGGAGTFAAGMRYAKPTFIVPFGGDQPFNAIRAHRLGLGPKPLKSDSVSFEEMRNIIKDLVGNEEYRKNAKKMSGIINSEDGVQNAANIIEEYINE